MIAVFHGAALVVTAAGLVAAAVALARTRQVLLPLAILLDFFTAASLLRLAGPPSWANLGTAALTIVIRQLASRSLRAAQGSGHLGLDPRRLRVSTIREAFRRR
jgi:hypothetical protein